MYRKGEGGKVLEDVRGDGTSISNGSEGERRTMTADTKVHGVAGGDTINSSLSVKGEARLLSAERGGRKSRSRFGHGGGRGEKRRRVLCAVEKPAGGMS